MYLDSDNAFYAVKYEEKPRSVVRLRNVTQYHEQLRNDSKCVKMFDTPMSGKGILTNINLFVVSLYILILYFR